jgi:hypothetical protein
VILQDTLQDHADGLLTELQSPTAIWQVEVVAERYFTDAEYVLGDYVTLVQPASIAAPIGSPAVMITGQVLAIQVQQSAAGAVDVSMRVLEVGPVTGEVLVTGEDSDVIAGGYRTVTWLDSGTIEVVGLPIDVEYLIVAGGGGGGGSSSSGSKNGGGGGGAGGLLQNIGGPLHTLSPGLFNVVVGAGGAGGPYLSGGSGTNGSDSTFSTFTAVGGGAGKNPNTVAARDGLPGGSGGGGSGVGSGGTPGAGGAGTLGQGNNGGSGTAATPGFGGGGGGAGGVGGSPVTSGAGASYSISGSAVTYATGGAGGTTATTGSGAPGTDGLGDGGGGGQGTNAVGGAGGDGVVILKWAV